MELDYVLSNMYFFIFFNKKLLNKSVISLAKAVLNPDNYSETREQFRVDIGIDI